MTHWAYDQNQSRRQRRFMLEISKEAVSYITADYFIYLACSSPNVFYFVDKLRAAVVAQDMIYRKKMGFNSTEPELEHFETPQRKEAIRRVKYLFLVNNRTNTNHGNTSSANANSTMIDTFAGAHMKSLLAHTPHFEAKTSAELDGAIVDA